MIIQNGHADYRCSLTQIIGDTEQQLNYSSRTHNMVIIIIIIMTPPRVIQRTIE